LRKRAEHARERDPSRRRALRRAIAWGDGCLGSNCLRRALLEIALDRGAAREPVHMGLKLQGTEPTGHAWLGEAESSSGYDCTFQL
jgi:hypothetical protein